jgi:hypothetical protein
VEPESDLLGIRRNSMNGDTLRISMLLLLIIFQCKLGMIVFFISYIYYCNLHIWYISDEVGANRQGTCIINGIMLSLAACLFLSSF